MATKQEDEATLQLHQFSGFMSVLVSEVLRVLELRDAPWDFTSHRVQVPPYFGWSNGGEYVRNQRMVVAGGSKDIRFGWSWTLGPILHEIS